MLFINDDLFHLSILIIIPCLRLIADGGEAVAVAHDEGGGVAVGVAQRLPRAVEDDVGAAVVGKRHQEPALARAERVGLKK